jgi:segregation and condensation protein B
MKFIINHLQPLHGPPGGWPLTHPAAPAVLWAMRLRPAAGETTGDSASLSVACRRTAKMARLEAVLLVADVPLSPRRLAQLATLADATEARTLINRLNAAFEQAGTPFRVERVAAGYRLFTVPQFVYWLGKLHHREAELKLSPPSMETLTIIAYRQPITRADIEAIRGVQCSEMIKQLMERGLVRIGGEDESLGRPFLYETTRRFLEIFGMRELEELPLAAKLRRPGANQAELLTTTRDAAAAPPVAAVSALTVEEAG